MTPQQNANYGLGERKLARESLLRVKSHLVRVSLGIGLWVLEAFFRGVRGERNDRLRFRRFDGLRGGRSAAAVSE